MFHEFDTDHNGFLDSFELLRMMKYAVPGVSKREMRFLVAYLDSLDDDVSVEMQYSFRDLQQVLRMVNMHVVKMGGGQELVLPRGNEGCTFVQSCFQVPHFRAWLMATHASF